MITEKQIDKALDFLRESASSAAEARGKRLVREQWIKVVLAEEMKAHPDLPVSAQEREARCSPRYADALEAFRASVVLDEEMRFKREAAAALIEAWRTYEATRRYEGKAY